MLVLSGLIFTYYTVYSSTLLELTCYSNILYEDPNLLGRIFDIIALKFGEQLHLQNEK